ncbi:hypothetical protein ACFQW6_03520 [Nocardioides sp. GCM10028917]|uniref:effector-associated constant component EACC1 n=1 Tax=Nocardioides sp. GCM10028917 TaxID=3273408 RepID=UPI00360AE793
MKFDLTPQAPNSSDDARLVGELIDWLRADRPTETQVAKRSHAPSPEEMGVAEYVEAVVATTPAVTALLLTIRTWIKSRTGKVSVRIKTEDGREFEVDASNVDDVDGLATKLTTDR